MSFQRIDDAAKRIKAPPGCSYPQSKDWRKFQVDEALLEDIKNRLNSSAGGKMALIGPHGSGKTFFLLYLGSWWERRESPPYLSYYAPKPSELDLEEVRDQWEQDPLRGRPCLWLIDDIHNDHEGILSDVIELFEEIAQPNWWLIVAGWELPMQDKWADEEKIEWELTSQTIRLALQPVNPQLADDEALIDELLGQQIGLMQILWAAKDRPDMLRRRNFGELKRQYEDRVEEEILPEAREQRAILARLKFLGLPFVVRNPKDSELLHRSVWVQRIEYPLEGFELSRDDIAQILFKVEVRGTGSQEELINSFLEPLRSYIKELLRQRLLILPGKVFHSLRSCKRCALIRWLDVNLAGDGTLDDRPLIEDFLDEELLNEVGAAVVDKRAELADAVRTMVTLEPYTPPDWVQEMANAILQAWGRDQLLALLRSGTGPSDRLSLWHSLAALARLSEDVELREAVVHAVGDESLRAAFVRETSSKRGKILGEAKRTDERAYRILLDAHCESLAAEIRDVPPRGAWNRLRTLRKWESSRAVELLESLGLDSITSLIFKAPQAARLFLAAFNKEEGTQARKRVEELFRQALRHRKILKEEVQVWTNARDLGSFVYLARGYIDVDALRPQADRIVQEENPAVIIDVSREVAKYAQTSHLRGYLAERMLESIKRGDEPIIERLGALERLDSRLLTRELLERVIPRWREYKPVQIFHLLFLLMSRQSELAELGKKLAREIVNGWQLILKAEAPLAATALAGLCLFVLGDDEAARIDLPLDRLLKPSPKTKPPESPEISACQLLALAKEVSGPGTPGYENLEWLIEHVIVNPSRNYYKNWHRSPVRSRRLSLNILCVVLRELKGKGREFTQLTNQFASGIADPRQDEIWNDHIRARLEAVQEGLSSQDALELLKRCGDEWSKIIQEKILRSRSNKPLPQGSIETALQILRYVVTLVAKSEDDTAKGCAESLLDAAASQIPNERQGEIEELRGQLSPMHDRR